MLYLRLWSVKTSAVDSYIPLIAIVIYLWRQEWYTFDAEVGRPRSARVLYLRSWGCKTSKAKVGRPLMSRLVNLATQGLVNPALQGLFIYWLNDIHCALHQIGYLYDNKISLIGRYVMTIFDAKLSKSRQSRRFVENLATPNSQKIPTKHFLYDQ